MTYAPRTPRWHVIRWVRYWWKFRPGSPWMERRADRRFRAYIRRGKIAIARGLKAGSTDLEFHEALATLFGHRRPR